MALFLLGEIGEILELYISWGYDVPKGSILFRFWLSLLTVKGL